MASAAAAPAGKRGHDQDDTIDYDGDSPPPQPPHFKKKRSKSSRLSPCVCPSIARVLGGQPGVVVHFCPPKVPADRDDWFCKVCAKRVSAARDLDAVAYADHIGPRLLVVSARDAPFSLEPVPPDHPRTFYDSIFRVEGGQAFRARVFARPDRLQPDSAHVALNQGELLVLFEDSAFLTWAQRQGDRIMEVHVRRFPPSARLVAGSHSRCLRPRIVLEEHYANPNHHKDARIVREPLREVSLDSVGPPGRLCRSSSACLTFAHRHRLPNDALRCRYVLADNRQYECCCGFGGALPPSIPFVSTPATNDLSALFPCWNDDCVRKCIRFLLVCRAYLPRQPHYVRVGSDARLVLDVNDASYAVSLVARKPVRPGDDHGTMKRPFVDSAACWFVDVSRATGVPDAHLVAVCFNERLVADRPERRFLSDRPERRFLSNWAREEHREATIGFQLPRGGFRAGPVRMWPADSAPLPDDETNAGRLVLVAAIVRHNPALQQLPTPPPGTPLDLLGRPDPEEEGEEDGGREIEELEEDDDDDEEIDDDPAQVLHGLIPRLRAVAARPSQAEVALLRADRRLLLMQQSTWAMRDAYARIVDVLGEMPAFVVCPCEEEKAVDVRFLCSSDDELFCTWGRTRLPLVAAEDVFTRRAPTLTAVSFLRALLRLARAGVEFQAADIVEGAVPAVVDTWAQVLDYVVSDPARTLKAFLHVFACARRLDGLLDTTIFRPSPHTTRQVEAIATKLHEVARAFSADTVRWNAEFEAADVHLLPGLPDETFTRFEHTGQWLCDAHIDENLCDRVNCPGPSPFSSQSDDEDEDGDDEKGRGARTMAALAALDEAEAEPLVVRIRGALDTLAEDLPRAAHCRLFRLLTPCAREVADLVLRNRGLFHALRESKSPEARALWDAMGVPAVVRHVRERAPHYGDADAVAALVERMQTLDVRALERAAVEARFDGAAPSTTVSGLIGGDGDGDGGGSGSDDDDDGGGGEGMSLEEDDVL